MWTCSASVARSPPPPGPGVQTESRRPEAGQDETDRGYFHFYISSSSSSSSSITTPTTTTAPTAAAQAAVSHISDRDTTTGTTPASPDSSNENQDYTCPHCDRTFTSRIVLVGHLRIHRRETGEPVPEAPTYTHRTRLHCPHCPRTFTRRMGLFDHMRIHESGIDHNSDTPTTPIMPSTTLAPSICATTNASSGVWWNAKVRIRPSHPPAASLVSGLLDSVLTPGSGEGGGESVGTAPHLSSDGRTLLTEKTQILQRSVEHFRGILNRPSTISDAALASLLRVETYVDLDLPPSPYETIRSVQQLSSGKAPGLDAIPAEVYKHGGSQLIDHLMALS
nr:unnamed protein product [Spirometra erinaceieuropaei]